MLRISLAVVAICLVAGIYSAVTAVRSSQRGRRVGWSFATVAFLGGASAILFQPVETHAVKIDLPVSGH